MTLVGTLYFGLVGRLRQAQTEADGFCRRVYKEGGQVIAGHAILSEVLKPLETHCTAAAQAAQDTAHRTQTVAHFTEAEVLSRVAAELQKQGAAPAQGSPLQGAQAPGQTAVPPGAMPITLPQPQHPKPKRRGATPPKKVPPGTSAPKSKKKG